MRSDYSKRCASEQFFSEVLANLGFLLSFLFSLQRVSVCFSTFSCDVKRMAISLWHVLLLLWHCGDIAMALALLLIREYHFISMLMAHLICNSINSNVTSILSFSVCVSYNNVSAILNQGANQWGNQRANQCACQWRRAATQLLLLFIWLQKHWGKFRGIFLKKKIPRNFPHPILYADSTFNSRLIMDIIMIYVER
jgi:hypothetical protein